MTDEHDPLSPRSLTAGIIIGLVVTVVGGVLVFLLTQPRQAQPLQPGYVRPTVSREPPSAFQNSAPEPVPAPQIARKVGREKRLYRFEDFPDGIIRVAIRAGEVDFYPKGGRILIVPPPPAEPWEDEPGTEGPRVTRPTGVFTIKRVSSQAWGVAVWN